MIRITSLAAEGAANIDRLDLITGSSSVGDCGDVDRSGGGDIVDALLTAQYYVELNPAGFNPGNADVNGDGQINLNPRTRRGPRPLFTKIKNDVIE